MPNFISEPTPCPYRKALKNAYFLAYREAARHGYEDDPADYLDYAMNLIMQRLETHDPTRGNFVTYMDTRLTLGMRYDFRESTQTRQQRLKKQQRLLAMAYQHECRHDFGTTEGEGPDATYRVQSLLMDATPRQRQVMEAYLATEGDTATMSQRLGITVQTIYATFTHIRRRHGVQSMKIHQGSIRHCKRGHTWNRSTHRLCPQCHNHDQKAYIERKRAAADLTENRRKPPLSADASLEGSGGA
jgi:hypothetical protein